MWSSPAGSSGRLRIAGARQGGAELWEWVLFPGDRYSSEPDPSGSEELVLVQSGTLTLMVEEDEFTLGPGTCARLATDVRYGYRNHGSEPARFVRTTRIA